MDGIHDLGGMDGFGEITVEKNEPTFHNQWEGQSFALNIVAIGVLQKYNADEYRHTRMPAYVRGRQGEIMHVAPYGSGPDNAAHGGTLRKEPTYHVMFTSSELWNDDEANSDTVVVDLWESYLEKVL